MGEYDISISEEIALELGGAGHGGSLEAGQQIFFDSTDSFNLEHSTPTQRAVVEELVHAKAAERFGVISRPEVQGSMARSPKR